MRFGEIAVDPVVAVAEMDAGGLALEFFQIERAGVGEHEVAHVDVRADARVAAVVHAPLPPLRETSGASFRLLSQRVAVQSRTTFPQSPERIAAKPCSNSK